MYCLWGILGSTKVLKVECFGHYIGKQYFVDHNANILDITYLGAESLWGRQDKLTGCHIKMINLIVIIYISLYYLFSNWVYVLFGEIKINQGNKCLQCCRQKQYVTYLHQAFGEEDKLLFVNGIVALDINLLIFQTLVNNKYFR